MSEPTERAGWVNESTWNNMQTILLGFQMLLTVTGQVVAVVHLIGKWRKSKALAKLRNREDLEAGDVQELETVINANDSVVAINELREVGEETAQAAARAFDSVRTSIAKVGKRRPGH